MPSSLGAHHHLGHRARVADRGARAPTFVLLEQPREPTVGEGLAARLAGGAVLEGRVAERDLSHRVTADGARLALAPVHAQPRLLLRLQISRSQAAGAVDAFKKRSPSAWTRSRATRGAIATG